MEQNRTLYVADLRAEASLVDKQSFCRRFDHPFLVLTGTASTDDDDDDEPDFHTSAAIKVDVRDLADILAGRKLDPNARVFRVAKNSATSPFSGFVSIGRTGNCDIVLPSSRVSKFHAYVSFRPAADGSIDFSIADGGSRNGTRLNGDVLEPRIARGLASGDVIDVGGAATLRFFTNDAIWEFLVR